MSGLTLGQLRELAKKYGKEYGREFITWAIENGIFKSATKIDNECIKDKEFKNKKEYRDHNARNRGYKNYSETINERNWNKGKHSPLSENEECSSWFGVFITENLFKEFLLTIFEYVEHMDYGNRGFDFVCKNPRKDFIDRYPQFKLILNKEYKIQVESKCLYYRTGKSSCWGFHIEHNNIADYFILSGWNTRGELYILYAWMFHRDEMVRKGNSYSKREKFWKRESFTITYNPKYLKTFKKYELPIDKLRELCDKLKND